MLHNVFTGCLGMTEMELAAERIFCKHCRIKKGDSVRIDDMVTDSERTGFLELLDRGFLTSKKPKTKNYRYNGEFFVAKILEKRLKDAASHTADQCLASPRPQDSGRMDSESLREAGRRNKLDEFHS